LVRGCKWKDLRETAPSQLPPPVSDVYRVFEIDRARDRTLYGDARFLGALYSAANIGLVLTQYVAPALRDLFNFIGLCAAAPPPPVPVCPSVHPLTGSATLYVGFYTTRAQALAAARTGVLGYANTLAGLERNAFVCPNTACATKRLGRVTYIMTNLDSQVNFKYTLLNGSIMHEGRADFTWFATLTCV
jgi:hypothetical protein